MDGGGPAKDAKRAKGRKSYDFRYDRAADRLAWFRVIRGHTL
jgi:hypothetical protein